MYIYIYIHIYIYIYLFKYTQYKSLYLTYIDSKDYMKLNVKCKNKSEQYTYISILRAHGA